MALCTFVMAMTGLFLYDGTTNESFAFTTPDCRVCHTGGSYPTVIARHHSIPRGCASCHRNGTPQLYNADPNHQDRNCLTCHFPGTTIYKALDVTTAHAPLHDKTAVPSTSCADCHLPAAIGEHAKYPIFAAPSGELDCDRCHKNTNTDPALGPINVQETIALGSDPGGVIVTCDQCHTNIAGEGHAAAHDNVFPNSTDCTAANCHVANVMTEHTNRGWTCGTCHNGQTLTLDPALVQQVVTNASGPYNPATSAYCTDCHGSDAGTHVAAHNQGFFLMTPSTQNCTQCHAAMDTSVDPNWANLVVEHVTNRGLTCGTCHDRTDQVFDTINKGRDPSNMPVYCNDCHEASGQGKGHAPVIVEPWSECTWCHTIDIFDYPQHTMHLAAAQDMQKNCSVCHVPEGTRPDCILCHSLEQTIWDPLPIHRTAPNNSLNIKGPGTEDHDKHTSGIGCAYCHVSGVPGSEPLPVPYSECTKCHNVNGPGSDIAYGSTVHTVNHIQGAEAKGQGCAYCHSQTPACTDCHQIAGPNMPQHDTHTDTLMYTCTECHINGIAGSKPLPAPYDQCASCHNPTGPGSDIVYGSPIHTNNHIVGGENSGQGCNLCHGQAAPDCSSCHAPGHPPIPPPYNECSTCHNGTGGTINIMYGQPGHNTHMSAANNNCAVCHTTQPNCGQCHTAGDHVGAHDNVGVPSTGCLKCHDANVVVEHIDNRNFSCADCHGNPTYAAIIEKGQTDLPENFVYCYDCHGQNNHHATAESQSGNCTYCHADPRLEADPNAPSGQLACRQCHGTNQHNNGGPIQDYGACFACHQPSPYHAKPTTWPGWYGENTAAPGRGTFNLFSSELRPRCAGDCEGSLERRSGYGEHSQPENDQGRNWRNPSISFSMVTFYDFFNTKKQWTVPTFGPGSGGGTPPPQVDSINITYASYSSSNREMRVYATNSLGHTNVTLTVMYDNHSYPMAWDSGDNRWEVRINTYRCSDSTIEVVSSAGGSASSSVNNCSSYSSYSGH